MPMAKKYLQVGILFLLVTSFVLAFQNCSGGGGGGGGSAASADISATAGNAEVTITWNEVSGSNSYQIFWSTTTPVNTNSADNIDNATSPYVHTGLTNGTPYYYVVRGLKDLLKVSDKDEVSATPSGAATTTTTAAFAVSINLTTGIISFPNKYSGWAVGGGSATNYVAYPSGWSVGGGSATIMLLYRPAGL